MLLPKTEEVTGGGINLQIMSFIIFTLREMLLWWPKQR